MPVLLLLRLRLAVGSLARLASAEPAAPSGLEVAAAIEETIDGAIAHAEKSVVAIARVRRSDRETIRRIELRTDPFGRYQIPAGSAAERSGLHSQRICHRRGRRSARIDPDQLTTSWAKRAISTSPPSIAGSIRPRSGLPIPQRSGRAVDRGHRPGADQAGRRRPSEKGPD